MESEAIATADASAFVAKWRGAWPEWAIAEVFLPPGERAIAPYWQALQFEQQEAAWGGADARPGEAKLGWWTEEFAGWALGRRRHPLGVHLMARPAPWGELARALPALRDARPRPSDSGTAWRAIEPVVSAVTQCEARIFGSTADARTVAACWLVSRVARHPADAVPADHSPPAWAADLLRAWPGAHGAPAVRRIELALARARLRSGRPGEALGPVSTLWAGWRAARD